MNNYVQDEQNQNYNYGYQTSGEQDIQFQQAMPMENNEYNFNEVDEKLPPIYTQQIASIKETNETQVKYLEPIELSNDIDVNKFLSSGKLMKQIEPEILRIKQEAQKEEEGFLLLGCLPHETNSDLGYYKSGTFNDKQFLKMHPRLVTLFKFHLDISGKFNKDEQL